MVGELPVQSEVFVFFLVGCTRYSYTVTQYTPYFFENSKKLAPLENTSHCERRCHKNHSDFSFLHMLVTFFRSILRHLHVRKPQGLMKFRYGEPNWSVY